MAIITVMKQANTKNFIIYFFIIIFLQLPITAEENLDTLLDIYAKENDLSKKTKKEAAGNVIIYTKQDLERMQVKSLSELLKNIPFYTYNENKLGYTDLLREDGFPSLSSDARVYINEREVTSPFYGNGLGIVSKFDLAYIDHIEIYTGVTSFEFGVEPASMVVRLYTKNPNREIGGHIKTSVGSNNSSENSISYSDTLEDFSYYAYVNKKTTNEKKIYHEDTPLSRDKESKHLFLSLQNDTNRLEYNRIEANSDLFMDGIGGGDGSPNENNTEVVYNLLGWYSTYLEDKVSLSLDYISDTAKTKESDDEPLDTLMIDGGFINPFLTGTLIPVQYNSYYVKSKEKQVSAVLKYKESIANHNLLSGLQYRKKDFSFSEINANVLGLGITNIDNNILPNLFKYTSEKLYGAFIEDTYSINDNQAIIAAIKQDIVKPNGGLENQNLSLYMLGYIYSNSNFSFKTFLVSTESRFDPNYYTRFNVASELDPQRDDSINMEATWKRKSLQYGINLFKTKQTNKLYSNNGIQNLSKPYYRQGVSLKNTYNFNKLNRLDTNFYIMNTDNELTNEKDTVYGGYIRLLNTYNKLDFYNEVIYKDGYKGLEAGYDFNSAITYKYSPDLSISIKGENIFNKALKTTYEDLPNNLGPISVATKKFWFTMEYRF
jgi:iron complex outermembrane receptor protein